jgi:hypothetical protein
MIVKRRQKAYDPQVCIAWLKLVLINETGEDVLDFQDAQTIANATFKEMLETITPSVWEA